MKFFQQTIVAGLLLVFTGCGPEPEAESQGSETVLQPLGMGQVWAGGELETRALKNYDRLESEVYTPERVFSIGHEPVSPGWPGDYEGRIILALSLQAQATHREPRYLQEMIEMLPSKVNEKGYLGPVMGDSILEQQLSGHGWLLRGLCEYYEWKKDPQVKQHIVNIIEYLALPTLGYHKTYPIDPGMREKDVGAASGTTQNSVGRWKLSSDIGCDFIFMDGVIHAYSLFPDPRLKPLIDEMIGRFLEMDLVAINAQTHATLTGLRGLLRYYALTREPWLLDEATKRYKLYRETAMTENYENYNWFERPEWTEPCAIVDAFMVAMQLWQFSDDPAFISDAHLIYYNALAHTQRANGGFGLDNCPGPEDNSLFVHADEAYWCCTMRGGEGLARAIQYNYFSNFKDRVILPFFNNGQTEIPLKDGLLVLKQESEYPFQGKVDLSVAESALDGETEIGFYLPTWANDPEIRVNDQVVPANEEKGFLCIRTTLTAGDQISYRFQMQPQIRESVNTEHSRSGYFKFMYGPLVLGYTGSPEATFDKEPSIQRTAEKTWEAGEKKLLLTPVFHVLDPRVKQDSVYRKQLLFKIEG